MWMIQFKCFLLFISNSKCEWWLSGWKFSVRYEIIQIKRGILSSKGHRHLLFDEVLYLILWIAPVFPIIYQHFYSCNRPLLWHGMKMSLLSLSKHSLAFDDGIIWWTRTLNGKPLHKWWWSGKWWQEPEVHQSKSLFFGWFVLPLFRIELVFTTIQVPRPTLLPFLLSILKFPIICYLSFRTITIISIVFTWKEKS